MVSDDPSCVPWQLPRGHCWVLADNEDVSPSEVIDSRSFGPLPLSNVLGRVIYTASSPTDHGPVSNSPQAARQDGPILAAELDVEEFSGNARGGT